MQKLLPTCWGETSVKKKGVFVVWFPWERRAEELAGAFGYRVEFVQNLLSSRWVPKLLRLAINYPWKALVTWILLFRHRPEVVVAQSPPAFCPMVCRVYCALMRVPLIVDGHNGAYGRPWTCVPGYCGTLRAARCVLVHNLELRDALLPQFPGTRLKVLNDKIPEGLDPARARTPATKKNYFFAVCSYDEDEPIIELLEAIKMFVDQHQGAIQVLLSGDHRKRAEACEAYANVDGIVFTGFLSRGDYDAMLAGAFGVLCLSIGEHVQQCGSIEALAMAVPMIISDSPTNRTLFPKGALLTANDRSSILRGMQEFLPKRSDLAIEVASLRGERIAQWWRDFQVLRTDLGI